MARVGKVGKEAGRGSRDYLKDVKDAEENFRLTGALNTALWLASIMFVMAKLAKMEC